MGAFSNLPPLEACNLADLIPLRPGRVVSMTLAGGDHCQMTLLAFGDGEGVSEERYPGDTLYCVLEGAMALYGDGRALIAKAGECLMAPAGIYHAIGGQGPFKVLQITLL